jgi:hypothetical protein
MASANSSRSSPVPKDSLTTGPKTISVPHAGKVYFGLGRNASYNAAKRGEIPTIKIGGRLCVPVILLERKLEEAGGPTQL